MENKWVKTEGTSDLTECFGDYGYIFKTGKLWVACTIFDSGEDMDTPCRTQAKAKQVVEIHAKALALVMQEMDEVEVTND